MRGKRLFLVMFVAMSVCFVTAMQAQVPQLINYQGQLTDDDDLPLNGSVDLEFRIYASASDGSILWSERHDNRNLTNGTFEVVLGSREQFPSDLFDSASRYLEVLVDGESLSPRRQFASVPYAITSRSGNGVSGVWSQSGNNIYYTKGNVGIGTTTPNEDLEVVKSQDNDTEVNIENSSSGSNASAKLRLTNDVSSAGLFYFGSNFTGGSGDLARSLRLAHNDPAADLRFHFNGGDNMVLKGGSGNVGIGTMSPNFRLHVNGTAGKPGGGAWSTASDARLKDVKGHFSPGLEAIAKLNPVRYRYKKGNPLNLLSDAEYIGLIAQDVQKVIPEAVGEYEDGYLSVNNDPIIWTMLNAIKELKSENQALKVRIEALEKGLGTNKSRVLRTSFKTE